MAVSAGYAGQYTAHLDVFDSVFAGNMAGTGAGGALAVSGPVELDFDGVLLTDNDAMDGRGGGLSVDNAMPARLSNLSFVRCGAHGLRGGGGGAAFMGTALSASAVVFSTCTTGADGGALLVADSPVLTVSGSAFFKCVPQCQCAATRPRPPCVQNSDVGFFLTICSLPSPSLLQQLCTRDAKQRGRNHCAEHNGGVHQQHRRGTLRNFPSRRMRVSTFAQNPSPWHARSRRRRATQSTQPAAKAFLPLRTSVPTSRRNSERATAGHSSPTAQSGVTAP